MITRVWFCGQGVYVDNRRVPSLDTSTHGIEVSDDGGWLLLVNRHTGARARVPRERVESMSEEADAPAEGASAARGRGARAKGEPTAV